MSVSTGISRVTGFIRNWAMAYAIGATFFSSSYIVANNIPNMIYELVAGGVLSSVFIPIFIERWKAHGDEDASRLASSVLNVTLIALGLVALVATVWAEPFVRTQTFTMEPARAANAVFFFRFFAIQIVFYGAAAIFTGVLNSHRHFVAPAAGPIFNNLVVIATMFSYPHIADPAMARTVLAVGTTLGVVAQMAACVPPLIKMRWRWQPRIDWHHPALRRLYAKMVPVLGYVIVNLAGVSFRNAISFTASTRPAGAGPSALQYAWMFYQLPYGVFAVALATAIFPELSEHAARKDWAAFKLQFTRGLRANAALVIPAAAMLVALAYPLSKLYRTGAFSAEAVPLVAGVLATWGLGLFSFAAYMYTMKAFYSLQDTRTPMFTNIAATGIQVGLYWVLTVGAFGWKGIGLPGIPAGDAISYSLHLLALLLILRMRLGSFDLRATAWTIARVALAGLGGGLLAWGIVQVTPGLAHVRLGFVLQLLGGGVVGLAATYALARLMRVHEMEAAAGMIRGVGKRLFRAAS
jgi:putative peptidoglycan lipid II flippase